MKDEIKTNPSCDFISRASAIEAIASAEPKDNEYHYYKHIAIKILSEIPSTEVVSFEDAMQIRNTILFKEYMRGRRDARVIQTQAEECDECIHNDTNKDKITCKECASIKVEPKWNCIANFVAEQLERLKGMTDEERLKLLQTMFPSIEAVQGKWILVCDSEGEGDNLYRCSKCGCEYGCQEYDKPNFCPNCGARMFREDGEV